MIESYEIIDSYVRLFIPHKTGTKIAHIDLEDLEKILRFPYSWFAVWNGHTKTYYVASSVYKGKDENGKHKYYPQKLHKFILNYYGRNKVDHINHDTLDNRKENLRIITNAENSAYRKAVNKNSSTGVRNVNWGSNRKEYLVQFCKDGERFKWAFPLDQFEEACNFAQIKRKEIFGEFAGKG